MRAQTPVSLALPLALMLLAGCSLAAPVRPPPLPSVARWPLSRDSGKPRWVFKASERIVSTPALGPDGTIYVSALDQQLFAVSPSGKKRWSFKTSDLVVSSPATAIDGTVYVASRDGYLHSVKPSGTRNWKFGTQGAIDSSPTLSHDGTIYIASHDGGLYAISPEGKRLWVYRAHDKFQRSTPAMGPGGVIFVASADGVVHAVTPQGKKKWTFRAKGRITSSPATDADWTVYIGSWDGKLYAISRQGSLKWTFTTGGPILSTPLVAPDGTILIGSDDGVFRAVDPRTGSERWKFKAGRYKKTATGLKVVKGSGGFFEAPAAVAKEGTIYVGSVCEFLYALTPKGKLKWSFDTGGWVDNAPVIRNIGGKDVIYVTGGRRLFALNP